VQQTSKRLTHYLLLAVLCLGLYIPGLVTLPPVDRDEARFAQATRQMLEEKDFVRIRFQNQPRHKKPIGTHWIQAAVTTAVGESNRDQIWPYRIPSLLGATAAVLLIFGIGSALFDSQTALLGAALTASCLLLVVVSHQATTDAVLLATVVAAQGALGHMYVQIRRGGTVGVGIALAFWLAQGCGMLVKGPIVPMVSLLTISSLLLADRSLNLVRQLRLWWGIPLAAAIFCPWAIAVSMATNGAFFPDAIRSDLLPKLISGHESHGFFPGYYLLLVMVTFWPGSLFIGQGIYHAWQHRTSPAERFCLAWLVPTWLIFELVPTKLPHYVLPLYPALALLTARALFGSSSGVLLYARSKLFWLGFAVWSLVGLVFAAGIPVVPFIFDNRFELLSLLPAATAILILVFSWRYVLKTRVVAAAVAAVALSPFLFGPILQLILPSVNGLWLSRSAAQAVESFHQEPTAPPVMLAAVGYHEPSLVFLLGTQTKLVSVERAPLLLRDHKADLALISEKQDSVFHDRIKDLGLQVRVVETLRGFNYSKGKWLTLRLYALREQ
jgi:4-amino-4-deoxy-L-arabinose transferase-like glycosyltransferase